MIATKAARKTAKRFQPYKIQRFLSRFTTTVHSFSNTQHVQHAARALTTSLATTNVSNTATGGMLQKYRNQNCSGLQYRILSDSCSSWSGAGWRYGLIYINNNNSPTHLGRQDLVQNVRVVAQSNARVGRALVDVNILVDVHDVLSLRIYLHQYLLSTAKRKMATKINRIESTQKNSKYVQSRASAGNDFIKPPCYRKSATCEPLWGLRADNGCWCDNL